MTPHKLPIQIGEISHIRIGENPVQKCTFYPEAVWCDRSDFISGGWQACFRVTLYEVVRGAGSETLCRYSV
jgi:hypothetical protein